MYHPWQAHLHTWRHRVTPTTLAWLQDSGSMTARMQAICTTVEIEVLNQSWTLLNLCEARTLGQRPRTHALQREVIMHCDGAPWLYARSVFPHVCLQRGAKRVLQLGNTPLGHILFSSNDIHRTQMRYAFITPAQLTPQLVHLSNKLPARQSIFDWHGAPFLLNELLLPAMMEQLTQ